MQRGRYSIADYHCTVVGGELRAGDDALDARWCDAATFAELPLAELLMETLAEWGVLPRSTFLPGAQVCGSGRPGCSPPRASP